MALLLRSAAAPQPYPSLFKTKRGSLHLHHLAASHFSVRSQDLSSTSSSSSSSSSSSEDPSSPSSSSTGVGFGSSTDTRPPVSKPKKQKQKGKRERASVIRRAPVEVRKFGSERGDDEDAGEAKQLRQNESAFLLSWLGLGGIILAQGLILAASGFLPEQWDGFFVKYLYPSFTPTVFLFVAGTVAYGVFKYLQNEKFNKEN